MGDMFVYFYFLTYVNVVVMLLKESAIIFSSLLIYYYHVKKQNICSTVYLPHSCFPS